MGGRGVGGGVREDGRVWYSRLPPFATGAIRHVACPDAVGRGNRAARAHAEGAYQLGAQRRLCPRRAAARLRVRAPVHLRVGEHHRPAVGRADRRPPAHAGEAYLVGTERRLCPRRAPARLRV